MGGLAVTFTKIHEQREELQGGKRRGIKIECKQEGLVKND